MFECDALAQIVQNPSEFLVAANRHLSNRQMQRKRAAIAPAPDDLATDPDDLCLASREVATEIAVVLLMVRGRHQHVDVAPGDFGSWISEQPLSRRIERLDMSLVVDDNNRI